MDYQRQGTAKDLITANSRISAARKATPFELRSEYNSRITYNVDERCYVWQWVAGGAR